MKKNILSIIAIIIALSASAQDEARWIRKSNISPDGSAIVFSYQGDIFTVGAEGGIARQVTSNNAYDSEPIWTSDGASIVFSSYREGSKDIFISPKEGGAPKRLTTYPGNETPLCVLPDGSVVFYASVQDTPEYADFPGTPQLYKVRAEGERPQMISPLPVYNISINSDNVAIYEDYKGYEDPLRKHHTSSVTRDIWMQKDGVFTKLSTFAGENRNPVFAANGKDYYYISEQNGNFNIYKSSIDNPGSSKQITDLPTHPVRNISVARNGTILFSYNGDLYTVKEGGKPSKLSIKVYKDKTERDVISRNIASGITSISVSPNGKEIALIARGDVYVTSIEFSTTKRITDTPEQERNVCFSEDGKTLYYSSERNGFWGIYSTSLTEKNDKYFLYSNKFEEKLFTTAGQTCFQPAVSPDGKWLAFLRDRTDIVIKNIKDGKEKVLLQGINYSYQDGDLNFEWCPDSHYILSTYEADGGWNNADIAMIDIETGEITNLTESGYSDSSFRWALAGKAMTWESDKQGYRSHGSWGAQGDLYAMFFDAKAYYDFTRSLENDEIENLLKTEKEEKKEQKDSIKAEKKNEKIAMQLLGREDRIVRLTSISGSLGDHFLSPDGKKLYYTMRLEKGYDLCQLDVKKREVKVLQKGVSGRFYPDKDGKTIYIMGGSAISKLDVASGQTKSVTFSSSYDYRPAAEREYIFEHCWKQVSEKFYDADIHGIDWAGFRTNYEQFLPYINNNFDFQDLLSEMLGELNGSHTGARYYYSSGLNIACFGALYDSNWTGEGIKIAEVLPGGRLSIVDPEIKAGDIILAIDGKRIEAGKEYYTALTGKAGKKLILTVKKGDKEQDIIVDAGSSDSALLYKRWVRRNEEKVRELSGGRVGYIHVEDMDSPSFREAYSKLLGKYRSAEAVIVDTRHNGGGWLHDDLATLLGGKAYIEFRPRGQYIGTEPYSKWTKPSCVLMGEDNYSDACGFPYTYRALGIGKLIGAPVPGTMTAVWWEYQIDQTLVFGIPQVTSWGLKEDRPLENLQIEPDILVYNNPAEVISGKDAQLEAAVQEMLKTIE